MNLFKSNILTDSKHFANKYPVILAALLLGINLIMLFWYLFVGYKTGFHSDSAAKVLLAREIYDTRDYFPDEWNYVNNDIFVLFGHTFIIPLLAFMPAGFKAHAISGGIWSGLILFGIWLVTGLGEIGKARRLLIVAVFAGGMSPWMAENLYGQVSYGYVLFVSAFIVFLSWRFLDGDGPRRHYYGATLLVILVLAFWQNPQRALVYQGLPLAAALGWYCLILIAKNNKSQSNRNSFELGIILFVGVVVGIILHAATIAGVNNVLGAGHARWLQYDDIIRNMTFTFIGYLAILGGLPSAGQVVVSVNGVFEGANLGVAILSLVLLPYALLRAFDKKMTGMGFLAAYGFCSLLTVLFVQFFTTVPVMSDPVASSRYLVPPIALILVLLLSIDTDFKQRPFISVCIIIILVVLLGGAMRSYGIGGKVSELSGDNPGQNGIKLDRIAKYLIANGFQYGYASYWNSSVLSVLSDEKLRVRAVSLVRTLSPFRHLSSDRWYRSSAWKGETFLLLSKKEAEEFDVNGLAIYGVKPLRKLEYDDWIVYVFHDNLADKLPGWDASFENPLLLSVSKDSFSQIGRFSSGNGVAMDALVAEKGDVGALHFGPPHIELAPGEYVAKFNIQADFNQSGAVRLDVATAPPEQHVLAEKVLLRSNEPVMLNFKLSKVSAVEFRVWALGSERVSFSGVTIEKKSNQYESVQ